jgi:lysophospholipase L1-like esterase
MPWRKLTLSALVLLLAMEATLQAAALAVALCTPAADSNSGARSAVVCLGDSYTFGIGSTQPGATYPAQLQSRLRASGHSAANVGNGGCPGQNSEYMLRRLPSLLKADTQVLCMLMAFNDTWSSATPVELQESHFAPGNAASTGFRWIWRTGRLIALCSRFFQNSWHRTSAEIAVTANAMRQDASLIDQTAGFDLLLRSGVLANEPTLPTFPPACPEQLQRHIDEAFACAAREDQPGALQLAQAIARENEGSPFAWQALVVLAFGAGDTTLEGEGIAQLTELTAKGVPAAAESLMLALDRCGHTARALEAAAKCTEANPSSLLAWKVRQQAAFQLGDWEQFETAAAAGLRLADRFAPTESALVARHYAQVVAPRNPSLAADLMVAAALLDGDADMLYIKVQSIRHTVARKDFKDAVDRASTGDPKVIAAIRERFRQAWDEPTVESDSWAAALEANMLEAGRICKERGIRVVIVGYPFPHPGLEAIQRKVAAKLAAPFIDVRARFDHELQTRAREELFVRDGHCTDAGYVLIAELVAPTVLSLLRD